MLTVYKYNLDIVDEQVVTLPRGAKILSCQQQRTPDSWRPAYDGGLQLWALVDTDATHTRDHIVRIFGTGNPVNDKMPDGRVMRFVDTVITNGGSLVWHVFADPSLP